MSRESDSELSSLYRRGAREEPPAWLDRAIVAAAQDEAAATRPAGGSPAVQRWQAPFALAAVLVVAVSVHWWAVPPAGELEGPPAARTQPLPAEQWRERNPDGFPPQMAAGRSEDGPGSMEESNRRLAQVPELPERTVGSDSGDASRARAARPLAPRQAAVQTAPSSVASDQPIQRQLSDLSEPAARYPQSLAAPPPPAPAPARSIAPPTGVSAEEAKARAGRPLGQASVEGRSPVERGDSAAKSASTTGDATHSRSEHASESVAAKSESGSTAARKAEAERPADNAASGADTRPRSQPEQWLKEIEALFRQGRVGEAQEQLTAFRKRFPDHELPQSLRER